MYSDVFCKVYNEFGWNYYPEIFGEQLLKWLQRQELRPKTALDLACGTGILCRILHENGIQVQGMDLSEGMIRIAHAEMPEIFFEEGDMITYRPAKCFELVTCTGDALNHIAALLDVEQIFRNVYAYTAPGGYFIFDLLREEEISSEEPFEMDFSPETKVWFQMTRPEEKQVNLKIRVFEEGTLRFEENIRETVHDPMEICRLLQRAGFQVLSCANHLPGNSTHGTTWFLVARK